MHRQTVTPPKSAAARGLELEQNQQGNSRFQCFFHMTQTYSSLVVFLQVPKVTRSTITRSLLPSPTHTHLLLQAEQLYCPNAAPFYRVLTTPLDQDLHLCTSQCLNSPWNISQSTRFKKKLGKPLQSCIYFKSLHKERHESKFRKSWHRRLRMTMRLQGVHQTFWLWRVNTGKLFPLGRGRRARVSSPRAPSHRQPSPSVTPGPTSLPCYTRRVLA